MRILISTLSVALLLAASASAFASAPKQSREATSMDAQRVDETGEDDDGEVQGRAVGPVQGTSTEPQEGNEDDVVFDPRYGSGGNEGIQGSSGGSSGGGESQGGESQ